MISSATSCSSLPSSSSPRSSSPSSSASSSCNYRPFSYSSPSFFTNLCFLVALVMMLSFSTTAEGARIPRSLASFLDYPEQDHKSLKLRGLKPRDRPTQCSSDERISAICYQCAERHRATFTIIYDKCCEGIPNFRETCEYMFIEDPKRGVDSTFWDY